MAGVISSAFFSLALSSALRAFICATSFASLLLTASI
eukprot:CAMPEP_0173394544 /NCGR_PEP_ID=MMETSP1356-20130122/28062_1 /TAXON_ID=77927 ORGANISM="Hemiselmis virescens, Strain PCC157" /NCGR_SAMPLE_ID=MMETSP1356 /ASSEMBLY_ACC=CAM_ASM_000847 /LENGTH=36 /DNA_ID= /DNA_START= /DNA_END= /DNA_ORIENTATION=